MNDSIHKRNIALVYAIDFSWMFLIVQAILVPLYTARGLGAAQILSIATIFSSVLLVLDVPAGYVADRYGHKKALVYAGIFKGVGGTILFCWQTYPGFILAFVLIGIGNSLFSGADVALLYRSHSMLESQMSSSSLLSRRLVMLQLGAAISAILGGFVGNVSFSFALCLNCIFAWIPFAISLFLRGDSLSPIPKEATGKEFLSTHRTLFGSGTGIKKIFFLRSVLLAILLIYVSVLQMYWQFIHVPLVYFGILWAAHSLFSAAVSHFTSLNFGPNARVLLFIFMAFPMMGFIGSALSIRTLALGLMMGIFFEIFRVAVSGPMNAAFNELLPKRYLATTNSIVSMTSRLIFILLTPVLGLLIENVGLPTSFLYLGVACGVLPLYFAFVGQKSFRL